MADGTELAFRFATAVAVTVVEVIPRMLPNVLGTALVTTTWIWLLLLL